MIRKLSFIALIVVSAAAAAAGVFAQQPVEPLERRLSRIMMSQTYVGSFLGVQTGEITKENFAKFGLREVRGVAVETVVKDSPAAQAGIQTGDVIVSFGGEEVTSVYKLTRLLNEVAPDHSAKITILRGGAPIELTATLGKRESPQFQSGGFNAGDFSFPGMPEYPRAPPVPPSGAMRIPVPPMPPTIGGDGNVFIYRGAPGRRIGVNAMILTGQLADYFGVASGSGLLISTVGENSPAARAGLKAGDVITEADGKALKSIADLIRALSDKKEGDAVTLTIVRDKNRQTVTVTPEKSKETTMPFQYFGDPNSGGNQRQIQLRQLIPPPVQKFN